MYIAVDEYNKRIYIENAQAGHSYYCPVCNSPLITKNQGEIREHHFTHRRSDCPAKLWDNNMCEWHQNWQEAFPEDNREIIIQEDEQIHRADIIVGRCKCQYKNA